MGADNPMTTHIKSQQETESEAFTKGMEAGKVQASKRICEWLMDDAMFYEDKTGKNINIANWLQPALASIGLNEEGDN